MATRVLFTTIIFDPHRGLEGKVRWRDFALGFRPTDTMAEIVLAVAAYLVTDSPSFVGGLPEFASGARLIIPTANFEPTDTLEQCADKIAGTNGFGIMVVPESSYKLYDARHHASSSDDHASPSSDDHASSSDDHASPD